MEVGLCKIDHLHSAGSRLCSSDGRMDWASRYVLSVTMDDDFCVNALKGALRKHKPPEIFNTDQGAKYIGKAFTRGLKDHSV